MATAGALAALQARACSVDVTVNGLGERAGNARLEELVMALSVSAGIDSGIDTRCLPDLCYEVARLSRRPIPVDKPIVGEGVFRQESGIHVVAMIQDRARSP